MDKEEKHLVKIEVDDNQFRKVMGELPGVAKKSAQDSANAFKDLKTVFESVGTQAKTAADGVKGAFGGVKGVFDGLGEADKMVNAFQKIAKDVGSFTEGMDNASVASGIACGAVKMQEVAVGLLAGKLELATVAQGVLSAAMAAGPFLIAAGAITAVVAAVGLMTLASQGQESESQKMIDRAQELTEKLRGQREEQERLAEAQKEGAGRVKVEADMLKDYVAELDTLVDADGRVIEGQEKKAKFLMDQINSQIPGAISATEDETGALIKFNDTLEEQMFLREKNALLATMEAGYIEAKMNYAQSELDVTNAVREHAKAKEELAAFEEEYRNMSDYDQLANSAKLEEMRAAVETTGVALQDATAVNEGYKESIENWETTKAISSNEELQAAYTSLSDTIVKNTGDNKEALEQAVATTEETFRRRVAEVTAGYDNMSEAEKAAAAESLRQLAETHDAQVLASGEVGNACAAEIVASMGGKAEEITGAIVGPVSDSITKAREEAAAKSKEIGSSVMSGIEAGIHAGKGPLGVMMGSAIGALVGAAKKAADINSPSKLFSRVIGKGIAEGVAHGIDTNMAQAADSAVQMVDQVLTATERELEVLNAQLEKMEEEDRQKRADKEQKAHEKSLQEKYDKLGKAEKGEKQKILDEIADQEERWNEKQLDAQRKADETMLKEKIKGLEAIQNEYKKAQDIITREQERMAEKLQNHGKVFEFDSKSGEVSLGDMEQQRAELLRYQEVLQQLKDANVSDAFLKENILNLGVEEGTKAAEYLLELGPEAMEEYVKGWSENQELAKEIAKTFYADQLQVIKDEFTGKLGEALGTVPETTEGIGEDSVQGMIDGMYNKSDALNTAAAQIVAGAIASMRAAAAINSPSKKTRDLVGVPLTDGLGKGVKKALPRVISQMQNVVSSEVSRLSNDAAARTQASVSNAGGGPIQTYHSKEVIERTPQITFGGSLSSLARVLQPHISMESQRRGSAMIRGGATG